MYEQLCIQTQAQSSFAHRSKQQLRPEIKSQIFISSTNIIVAP